MAAATALAAGRPQHRPAIQEQVRIPAGTRHRPLALIATASPGFPVVQLDVPIVNVAPVRIGHALHGGMATPSMGNPMAVHTASFRLNATRARRLAAD